MRWSTDAPRVRLRDTRPPEDEPEPDPEIEPPFKKRVVRTELKTRGQEEDYMRLLKKWEDEDGGGGGGGGGSSGSTAA